MSLARLEALGLVSRPAADPLLDRLYLLPRADTSMEDFEIWEHLDLTTKSTAELRREKSRLEARLIFDEDPHPWLVARLERVRSAVSG